MLSRKHIGTVATLALIGVLLAHAPALGKETPFVPDEVLVKFAPGVAEPVVRAAAAKVGASSSCPVLCQRPGRHAGAHALRGLGPQLERFRLMRIGGGETVESALAKLSATAGVEFAEPNYIVSRCADAPPPSDPDFGDQWNLHNVGQAGGTAGVDIDYLGLLDLEPNPGQGVVIAHIDTGADLGHEDLSGRFHKTPREKANGKDDDGNGYIDDIYGYDFENDDGDPSDDNGHGTRTASIAAASTGNNKGIAGASQAKIKALKFMRADGTGTTVNAMHCLNYAVENGIPVSSNSWGGGVESIVFKAAIEAADAAGHVFVAAAGNDAVNNDLFDHFPSNYNAPNVIAVAATDRNDVFDVDSSYGPNTVHLAAPGVDIPSAILGGGYDVSSHTSAATPHVAAAAATLIGEDLKDSQRDFSARQIRALLMFSSDETVATRSTTIAGGRLNAAAALALMRSPSPVLTARPSTISVGEGDSFTVRAFSMGRPGATLTARVVGHGPPIVLDDGLADDDPGRDAADRKWKGDFIYVGTLTAPDAIGAFQVEISDGTDTVSLGGSVGDAYTYSKIAQASPYDLSTGATSYTMIHDDAALAPMGFSFNFGGEVHSEVYVNSNGNLSFGANNTSFLHLELIDAAAGIVAPLWDDFNPAIGGTIRTKTFGAAPSRVFVAEYKDVQHYGTSTPVTFQAAFFEQGGKIILYYGAVSGVQGGGGATIGVRSSAATQYSYNQENAVAPGDALVFTIGSTPPPNDPPTALATVSDSSVPEGTQVSFDGSGSTAAGNASIVSYGWTFGDGQTASGMQVTHTYIGPGPYTAALTVTDSEGGTDTDAQTITVTNVAPTNAVITGPMAGDAGQSLTFSATAVDPEGASALTYTWDFGDGDGATGQFVNHTYAAAGSYTVTVTATDSASASTQATHGPVQVDAPPPPQTTIEVTRAEYKSKRSTLTVYATASEANLTLIAEWGATGQAPLSYNSKRNRYELRLGKPSPQPQPGQSVVVRTQDGSAASASFPIAFP